MDNFIDYEGLSQKFIAGIYFDPFSWFNEEEYMKKLEYKKEILVN